MKDIQAIDKYLQEAQDWVVSFGGKLLGAIMILLIGFWIVNRFVKLLNRIMVGRDVDESLRPFLCSVVSIVLKVVIFIPVIQLLGIATTSFLAILGSAGLAVGLALQGSLANFAGGVILLILRPFKKGHYIKTVSEAGTVRHIGIFNTILKTPDNQTVFIPNGILAGGTIVNYSDEPTRRLVLDVSVGYDDDIPKAREIIKASLSDDHRVLHDPAWQIVVTQLADSAVVISTRIWVKNEDYWDVNFDLREKIKLAFDTRGITFPFPQATIHLAEGSKDLLLNKSR
jgi:small conductance mechanosensitive channel